MLVAFARKATDARMGENAARRARKRKAVAARLI